MWNKDEVSPDELAMLMQNAAADADADAAYEHLDDAEAVDTDLF